MDNEPVMFQALLVAAVNATLGLFGFIFNWSEELMASLFVASSAWIALAAFYARSKVTPTSKL